MQYGRADIGAIEDCKDYRVCFVVKSRKLQLRAFLHSRSDQISVFATAAVVTASRNRMYRGVSITVSCHQCGGHQ